MKVTENDRETADALAVLHRHLAAAYRRGLEDAAKVADVYTGKTTVGDAIRKLGEDA